MYLCDNRVHLDSGISLQPQQALHYNSYMIVLEDKAVKVTTDRQRGWTDKAKGNLNFINRKYIDNKQSDFPGDPRVQRKKHQYKEDVQKRKTFTGYCCGVCFILLLMYFVCTASCPCVCVCVCACVCVCVLFPASAFP